MIIILRFQRTAQVYARKICYRNHFPVNNLIVKFREKKIVWFLLIYGRIIEVYPVSQFGRN